MRSITDIVMEAREMYPAIIQVSDATIAKRIRDIEYDLYQFMGKETKKDITILNDGTTHYLIGTDFRNDNLLRVLMYDQTVGGGSTVVGTPYITVEDIESLKDYENNTYLKFTYISAQYSVATVVYRAIPADITADANLWDTTYPVIDDEYASVIIYKLIKQLAIFGDCPEITISNNYEREALQKISKAKADYYARKRRNNPNKVNYKDCW